MFSQASVILSMGEACLAGGMHGRGCVHHSGTCMAGGVHGKGAYVAGGGAYMAGGVHGRGASSLFFSPGHSDQDPKH